MDGHGTFHAMGGIKCYTPARAIHTSNLVPRSNESPSTAKLAILGSLDLIPYESKRLGTASIFALDVSAVLPVPESAKQAHLIDTLWMWGYKLQETPGPGWNGFMDAVTANPQHVFETAKVLPLPFVNFSPSNPTTTPVFFPP